MNWRTAIIGSIIGALALRVLLIPSTWIVLGFVALVLFWNFLLTQFQTQKKLINWGMGIFLALTLVSTIGLNLYNAHVKPYTAMSRAATERAKIAADLETALQINPHMLKSRMELANQIQKLQDKIGERQAEKMKEVENLAKEGKLKDAWEKISEIIKDENMYREKSKEANSKLSSVSTGLSLKPSSGGLAGKLAFIGAILLGIGLIPKLPGKGLWGGIGMLLLIAGLIIWVFPGIQASANTLPDWSRPAPKEQASAPTPKIAELACATVVVPAGEIVNTHFWTRPRQRVHLNRIGGGSSDPSIPSYYVHDKFRDSPIYSEKDSCEFSDSDYVWLKGGPVTTMVTLSK